MRRASRLSLASVLITLLWVSAPSAALALPWDGTNPAATECWNGSHPVFTLNKANIMSGSLKIGEVWLMHSAWCATVWSRVFNKTAANISAREKLITYSSPNGGGMVTYTETDTLTPVGTATDDGWSKQYRDRPSFKARGELFHNGAWRVAETTRGNMYIQFDGNYPTVPWTCDETPTNYCHRWQTNANGTPRTVEWAPHSSLSGMPGDATSDISSVVEAYEDLTGGSPNFTQTTFGNEEVGFRALNDPAWGDYAVTSNLYFSSFPQYYYYSLVTFNIATVTAPHKALACHEVGHVLGLAHVHVNATIQGSHATCQGDPTDVPGIDDQQALSLIYSTPLAPGP